MKKINEEKNEEINSINQLTNYHLKSTPVSTINYVTGTSEDVDCVKNPYFTRDSTSCNDVFEWENNDTFPTFLSENKFISIPKGIKRQLQRLPKRILLQVDKDIDVAIEKCLIVASNLTHTVFREDEDKWKSLSSLVLQEQVQTRGDNTFVYTKVLDALQYSTDSTMPIIETRLNSYGTQTYEVGKVSKQYRFSEKFDTTNFESYEIVYQPFVEKRRNYQFAKLDEAINNPIGRNLLKVYRYIQLPSEGEILARGRELVKKGYKSKKGKKLTLLNKKSKESYLDFKNRGFVEENIKQFRYLVSNGFMVPIIGDYKSGGRVVDSFNLMPSWIRSLVMIDGEHIEEIDFRALHPNIASYLYGGTNRYITHEKVAEILNRKVLEVKIEHLSFFNKHPADMMKSPLYEYYYKSEPLMLENIIKDKLQNGYRITSRKLFNKEVEIMSSCITALNSMGIYVIYVYDALYCRVSDKEVVEKVMNKIIVDNGVYTIVK